MRLLATVGDSAGAGLGGLLRIDLARECFEELLVWQPPAALQVAGKGFTGAAWLGASAPSELVVCAHSALVRVDVARRAVTGVLHQPCMNDLHDVAVANDRLFVANTGLDRIDVFTEDGAFVGGWDLAPSWVTAARLGGRSPSRASWQDALRPGWTGAAVALDDDPVAGDYYSRASEQTLFHARKVRDFVHPNHIAIVEGRVLVTRFQDRSVQDMGDWSLVIPDTPGHPHDGVRHDDRFWITCTHGLVVAYAVERGRVTTREVERLDVFAHTGRSGWCRGLVITDDLVVVGLTAVQRAPRYRWCDRPFEGTETSVLAIDRRTRRLVARVDLSAVGREPKLFALLEEQ